MDDIRNRGFLAGEIDSFRRRYRSAYSNSFATCEAKSDAATAQLFNADLAKLDSPAQMHVVMAVGFWCRSLRACQGAILLLEKGMVSEAFSLTRNAYECLFFAAALISDPGVMESLKSGDSHARREQAKSMLDIGLKENAWTPEQVASLEEVMAEHAGGKKQLSVYEAAEKAGMAFVYATVYRGLSFISSHATIASTDSVFEQRGEGFGAVFGPSDVQLEFCLGLVDTCLAEGMKRLSAYLRPA